MNKPTLLRAILVLSLSMACAPAAVAEISIAQLKERYKDLDWKSVANGKIVSHSMPQIESEPSAIAVVVMARINAPLSAVKKQMDAPLEGVAAIPIDVTSEATITESLKQVGLSPEDDFNLKWFRNPKADGQYNVSSSELAILKKASASLTENPDNLEPLNEAIRLFFKQRLEAYLEGGLEGILPYDIDGKKISAGDYLASSLQPLKVAQEQEPVFFDTFLKYPQGSDAYENEFFVVVEMDGGTRITSLRHWMISPREKSLLIAERKFYISHSLDAMHTLIFLEEQADNSTYIVLINTTFTEMVTGMGSFIAHKVGRKKITDNVMPMLTTLQSAFD